MVKNIFYSLFILLSSFHLALSQENYQFSGHLTDKFLDTPIPNAAILIMTEIDTLTLTTDDYGYFDGSFFYIGIADQNIPEKFEILSQNYPNPFNPATTIKYSQPGKIELFDVTGRLLFTQKLVGSNVSKTIRLPAGVYFYRITTRNSQQVTKKMLLIDGSDAKIQFMYQTQGAPDRNALSKNHSELQAHYSITKEGYVPFDTTITLDSEKNNSHRFYMRMENYPPVTSVPDIRVDRNGQTTINLNDYVQDAESGPTQMDWQATNYDPGLVSIVIGENNIATITNKDKNGNTHVTWRAIDPEGASGQNTSRVDINFLLKIAGQVYDGINDQPGTNVHVRVNGPDGIQDTLTGPDGNFAFYSPSTGDYMFTIVPNDTLLELEQTIINLTHDYDMGKVTLPHKDAPWNGYLEAQAAGYPQLYNYAFNKRMADGLGLPGNPGVLPTFFVLKTERTDTSEVSGWIRNYNAEVEKGLANYKLQPPNPQNIIRNEAGNHDEENALWKQVRHEYPDSCAYVFWQYHDGVGGGPSSSFNATSGGNPDPPPPLNQDNNDGIRGNAKYGVLSRNGCCDAEQDRREQKPRMGRHDLSWRRGLNPHGQPMDISQRHLFQGRNNQWHEQHARARRRSEA